MSLFNVAYLVMVVAAFTGLAVTMFYVWVWTNWSVWFPVPVKSSGASIKPVAADYRRAA